MLEICQLIGIRVRQIRKELRLTQEQLAEKADMDYRSIGAIERGERNLTLESISKVANALDVSIDYLLLSQIPKDNKIITQKDLLMEQILSILKNKDIKYLESFLEIVKR
ncbi:MAG: helix-turn-helix transcriptional regulator [bacterium]